MERIGIIGCGLMGAGIAEVCARAGLGVVVREVDQKTAAAGSIRIEQSLDRAVRRNKISATAAAEATARLTVTTDIEALADRDLVIEAAMENESLKLEIFALVDKVVVADDAILASNTSSIPIMKLAMATKRPQQVVGMHFFNPVPVLPLVEVITSLLTSEETVERAARFAREALAKTVIFSPDRAGFVVNALLVPYLLSAIRMVESGFATPEDIDTGMIQGCGHPMGPLTLCDLIGLDTMIAVSQSLYEEFKEPLFAPPPLLSRMMEAGLLGRKTGRGFYDYSEAA